MEKTEKYSFDMPTIDDDINESVERFVENFEKIENLLEEEYVSSIETDLVSGRTYRRAYKIWNSNPVSKGILGWVNIREGKFAKQWIQNKTYNIGDLVRSKANNGHVYRCTVAGVSTPSEPAFATTGSSDTLDFNNVGVWKADYNYAVGNCVHATDGDKTFYYKCTVAGITNSIEPNWIDTTGSSIYDGGVVWLVFKTVTWREDGVSTQFNSFGTIA